MALIVFHWCFSCPLHLTEKLQGTFHNIAVGCLGTAQLSCICQHSNENWPALLCVNTTTHTHTQLTMIYLHHIVADKKNSSILNYKGNIEGDCSNIKLGIYIYMVQSRNQNQLTQRQVWGNVSEQSCVGVCQEQHDHTFFTPLVPVSPHRHSFPEPLSSKTLHPSTWIFLSGQRTFNLEPKN